MTLQELFESDTSGLFDGPEVVEYKDHKIISNKPVVSTYTVRAPQGWIIYETSSIGTIDECKKMIDSRIQWQKEAK